MMGLGTLLGSRIALWADDRSGDQLSAAGDGGRRSTWDSRGDGWRDGRLLNDGASRYWRSAWVKAGGSIYHATLSGDSAWQIGGIEDTAIAGVAEGFGDRWLAAGPPWLSCADHATNHIRLPGLSSLGTAGADGVIDRYRWSIFVILERGLFRAFRDFDGGFFSAAVEVGIHQPEFVSRLGFVVDALEFVRLLVADADTHFPGIFGHAGQCPVLSPIHCRLGCGHCFQTGRVLLPGGLVAWKVGRGRDGSGIFLRRRRRICWLHLRRSLDRCFWRRGTVSGRRGILGAQIEAGAENHEDDDAGDFHEGGSLNHFSIRMFTSILAVSSSLGTTVMAGTVMKLPGCWSSCSQFIGFHLTHHMQGDDGRGHACPLTGLIRLLLGDTHTVLGGQFIHEAEQI